jgi:glycosyltransferase involved in cell wall biosynthesis
MPGVDFVGYVDSDSFLRKIDVLVVPSVWHDPSPRVISEAYAHGIAVMGARIGGIPELVEEGRTGSLFASGNSDDLARQMRKFTDHPTRIVGMRRNCLEKAEHLSPKAIAEQYLTVYGNATAKA